MVGWTFQDHKKGDLTIEKWGFHHLPGLVMTKSSPWKPWPIEIDGLPITNGDFPWQTVSHNQMVDHSYVYLHTCLSPLSLQGIPGGVSLATSKQQKVRRTSREVLARRFSGHLPGIQITSG